jgi:hypothetical protein
LLVTKDKRFAVAADEARDRVSVVDLEQNTWLGDVVFDAGSQPGRLVESADGLVHVVLRRAGKLASIQPSELTLVRQVDVCAAPRGVGYSEERDELLVACLSGRLVTLSSSGDLLRSIQLDNDLRDVVIDKDDVWVSRFKSAEVMRLDASGTVMERLLPPTFARSRLTADRSASFTARFEPGVAWRMVANPSGGVVVVHQRATTEELDVSASAESGASAYGSQGDCSGIQRSSITMFTAGGQVRSGPDVPVTLPIDVAIDARGNAAVIGAGRQDLGAPVTSFVSSGPSSGVVFFGSSAAAAAVVSVDDPSECTAGAAIPQEFDSETSEQYVVAVANDPRRRDSYLLQMREPAQLVIQDASRRVISLGGESVADTGFDLFHRNAEAGVSCASCHPDGSDDEHVWTFKGQGERRTQPLDVGLSGTAPFHWDGSLHAISDVMGEVFVKRMGGVHQSPERTAALTDWLFDLSPPSAEAPVDESQVWRGRRLFDSLDVGCADCHRGEHFTDNNAYDVGTGLPGEKFQVPSLIGVGTRSRFIHNGCAHSLAERFELPCGGGDRHGQVSGLSPDDIGDLIAYLGTL